MSTSKLLAKYANCHTIQYFSYDTPQFNAAKFQGQLVANMDRAPILTADGVTIGQSKAIERYVARVCGLMGSSELEASQIDCIAEHVHDIKEKWAKIKALQGADREAAETKWYNSSGGDLTEWLGKLERSLPVNAPVDCAVGSALSYADVCIWHLLSDTFENKTAVQECLKPCERLRKIASKVALLPPVMSWLSIRPRTVF
jgi:glutathione S-transferase